MERVTGVEPVSQPWEGRVLPMYYTRKCDNLSQNVGELILVEFHLGFKN